jgi:hypothetical protein
MHFLNVITKATEYRTFIVISNMTIQCIVVKSKFIYKIANDCKINTAIVNSINIILF